MKKKSHGKLENIFRLMNIKTQHTYGKQLKECLEKFIAVNNYIKKQEKSQNNLTFPP